MISDNQGYIFDIASKTAKPMTRDFDPSPTADTPGMRKTEKSIS